MRGEDELLQDVDAKCRGSPPHARGRHIDALVLDDKVRITPACAGKTPPARRSRIPQRDHPRMRGEDLRRRNRSPFINGSPPHARGRPSTIFRRRQTYRITPACAGKTLLATASSCCVTDHPRMRGEDRRGTDLRPRGSGSPPHARGRQLDSPGNPAKSSSSLPVFLHSQPNPLKRFLRRVLGL